MRQSRFALAGLVTLLLLVAAAAVVPSLLDWNRYRGNFAALASSVLGRAVRIDGAVSLSVLPRPTFSAGRISIAAGDDGIAMSARQLRLQVSLRGLLMGRLEPDELVLRQPTFTLPWPFNPAALTHRPDWLSGLSARIEDATIIVGGLEFSAVDGSFAPAPSADVADRDNSGVIARAHGTFLGRAWRVMARLGQPDAELTTATEAAVPAQLVLDGEGPLADTGASFTGQISANGAIDGGVTGRGSDLSQLVAAPAVAWRAEGRVSIADGLAVADDLAVQLAEAPGRAAVALRLSPLPRLDLALTAGRIDLDGWIDALLRPRTAQPPGLLTGVDLSADSGTLRGATLRRPRIAMDLRPAGVVLREASAQLPGDTAVAIDGNLLLGRDLSRAASSGAGPALDGADFTGKIQLDAPDLRATLDWLRQFGVLPPSLLPAGVLRQGALRADLRVVGGVLTLSTLAGTLDDSRFEGNLSVHAAAGSRLSVGGRLALDRLAIAPWLREFNVGDLSPMAWPALVADADFDADLRLEVARAVWQGAGDPVPINHLILDGALRSGTLTLRGLQAEALGLQAALSGGLSASGQVSAAQLLLVGSDATPLRGFVRDWLAPVWPLADELANAGLWRAPLDLKVTADGALRAIATHLQIGLGDLLIDANPLIDVASRGATGPLTMRHPGARRLFRQLGLGDAVWLGDGSFSLISQATLDRASIALDRIDLIAADLRARGRLVWRPETALLSGHLGFDSLPLPWPGFDVSLPVDWLQGWRAELALVAAEVRSADVALLRDASAAATLADRVLRLDGVTARLAGGQMNASVAFDSRATPPALTGKAALRDAEIAGPLLDLPLDLVAGRADGDVTFRADGYSAAGMMATLAGQGQASVRHGVLQGFDAGAAAAATDRGDATVIAEAARQALAGGATDFDVMDLQLTASPGLIDVAAHLTASGAAADLTCTFDLGGKRLDMTTRVQPSGAGAPPMTVRLTGPFQGPTRMTDLSALAAWLPTR